MHKCTIIQQSISFLRKPVLRIYSDLNKNVTARNIEKSVEKSCKLQICILDYQLNRKLALSAF